MWRLNRVRYYVLPGGKEGAPQTGEKRGNRAAASDGCARPADPGMWRDEVKAQEMPAASSARIRRMAVGSCERVKVKCQRFSVPFAAVVFALIGVPWVRRQRPALAWPGGRTDHFRVLYVWHYLGTLGKAGHGPFLAVDPGIAAAAIGATLPRAELRCNPRGFTRRGRLTRAGRARGPGCAAGLFVSFDLENARPL